MTTLVCEKVIIFLSTTCASVPTENYDVSELIRFLNVLKTVPIYYNREECIMERSPAEFIRYAGNLGYVRYKRDDKGNYYYFSKGNIFNQPVIILQTISAYLPCQSVYLYGETTIDALIDDIIAKLEEGGKHGSNNNNNSRDM